MPDGCGRAVVRGRRLTGIEAAAGLKRPGGTGHEQQFFWAAVCPKQGVIALCTFARQDKPIASTADVDDGDIVRVHPPPAGGMVEMKCRRRPGAQERP
jgi:hypothetical protein